jgi:hypothetical protein
MGYSRYITSGTTTSNGGFTHTVTNPDNGTFTWAEVGHIKVYISTANQTLSSFQDTVILGTAAEAQDYTLIGRTLTFSALTPNSTYQFQVKRVTPKLTHFVDFQAGQPLTELALDNSNKYTLYVAQELEDDMGDNNLTLTLMKSLASVSGDFVDTTSIQTVLNKTLPSTGSSGTKIDMGEFAF